MSNLVIVEHDNNEVGAATLHAVTAAQQTGGDIDLLVAGENCGAVAEAAPDIVALQTAMGFSPAWRAEFCRLAADFPTEPPLRCTAD